MPDYRIILYFTAGEGLQSEDEVSFKPPDIVTSKRNSTMTNKISLTKKLAAAVFFYSLLICLVASAFC